VSQRRPEWGAAVIFNEYRIEALGLGKF